MLGKTNNNFQIDFFSWTFEWLFNERKLFFKFCTEFFYQIIQYCNYEENKYFETVLLLSVANHWCFKMLMIDIQLMNAVKYLTFLWQKKLNGYAFPVYTTDMCPRDKTEWDKRSSAINCTKNNGYICIPNENRTALLEFCYIYPTTWINKGNVIS